MCGAFEIHEMPRTGFILVCLTDGTKCYDSRLQRFVNVMVTVRDGSKHSVPMLLLLLSRQR